MFRKFFKKLFGKKEKIKNFSVSFLDASEGENSAIQLTPKVKEVIKKIKKSDSITNEETNILIEYVFNKAPIEYLYYKLNDTVVKNLSFAIYGVNTVLDPDTDMPVDLILMLKETSFNADMMLQISIKEFSDFLTPIKPPENIATS